ncbi:MAG: glycosyltransferase [Deltaproteobacteria bacterium]|nr:glycosyltransferase [Deltaproteobacteria bacterium]
MKPTLLVAFEALRILLRVVLLALAHHLARASYRVVKAGWPTAASLPPATEDLPVVTVQLPIRNEYYVAERVVRATCGMDYPPSRLEIQVLDDSDDGTRPLLERLVGELSAKGLPIRLLTRDRPDGYKAGALNAGLAVARGELVAMFDADCVPPPDFLRWVVPEFADPTVGLVQVRWSFLNGDRSVLTRLQTLILDGLFAVDQHARSSSGMPFQFNGTSGVWRRRCLDETGPWRGEILAEDADMALRAYLGGWKLLHRPERAVPTEVPEDMAAFRSQQRRWARGTAQLLRSLFPRILRSGAPARARLLMLLHLGRHVIDPLLCALLVTTPFTTLYGMPTLFDYGVPANVATVGVVLAAIIVYYGLAVRRVGGNATRVLYAPLVVPLALGLAPLYTVSLIQGLLFSGGEFVRTPKHGSGPSATGPIYRSRLDPFSLVEVVLGLAHAFFALSAFMRGYVVYASFFATAALGLLWVGVGSLQATVGLDRRTEQ